MQVTIRKCQLLLIFDSKIGSWFEGAGDVVGYHDIYSVMFRYMCMYIYMFCISSEIKTLK